MLSEKKLKTKIQNYEREKKKILAENPNMSYLAYEQKIKELADKYRL